MELTTHRIFADKVLKVRNRPNWLLLSLVLVSVATGEVLPVLFTHLFTAGSRGSIIMTNYVIIVSQVVPAFIMPSYHLQLSGRLTWFVRSVMWLTAPAVAVPAYALRKLRSRHTPHEDVMDGLLSLTELKEYIQIHEEGEGYGGTLEEHVGEKIRSLLDSQINKAATSRLVERAASWTSELSGSVASASIHSLHHDGSTAINGESTTEPTSMGSHRQEGSTAIENIPAPGLKKRGERSTESHETIVTVVPMQVPQQAVIKDPIHGSSYTVSSEYLALCDLNRPRQDFSVKNNRDYPQFDVGL